MPYSLGKTLAVLTLSIVSIVVIAYHVETDSSNLLIGSTALERSGINNLDVEYADGKIYLNVELANPKTCKELIETLGIRAIVIKNKTFEPACSKVSNRLMRVTYTQTISV